ncbi:DUF2946 family protein [Novosphingobium sp. SG720]|uniref:DUF2946 family protein n=1 Tax=Novosphingobium sp. SG720 TaxID=2586998 RepID=UPI0014479B50|nr:DUF2946 family protein [Novosphingobium sp. SG720]NKJ42976.1 hypothetical protein [Novosphingobium sp. SG720]
MIALRAFLLRNRGLALALVALALAMKALVPAGYMVGGETRSFTIQLCSEGIDGRHDLVRQVVVPASGAADKADAGHAKAQGTCPFGALGHALLGGADPVLLAGALAFILALGFAPVAALAPRRHSHAWPPLRGPPLIA